MYSRRSVILLVLLSAILWGLYWVPLLRLGGRGFEGAWPGLTLNGGAFLVLAVATLARRTGAVSPRSVLGALLCGAAISLYGSAIMFTDVVRTVLFFYLAPVWSTVIECVFMGRRWTPRNGLAIAVTAAGLVAVLRGEIPIEGLGAAGDWMAIGSGLCWSIGASLMFSRPGHDPLRLSAVALGGALGASVATWLLGRPLTGAPPSLAQFAGAAVEIAGFSLLYLAPMIFIAIWGAIRLNPAALSFVLTAEIISGVASSALFLDQPFGIYEIAGATLIILGATLEVATPSDREAKPALE